ncbi:MAG: hypothetical protein DRO23_05495 [Thermoprotei archaeon]|nr:MAG: hypothetical protein DRO23_05495 [Thermoprotei archaeon]
MFIVWFREVPKRSKNSSKSRRRRKSKHTNVRKLKIDIGNLVLNIFEDAVLALGISHLGLTDDELKIVVRNVIEYLLSGISYKPSKSTILNRLSKGRIRFAPIISETILSLRKELSEDLLEYIVSFGGPICAVNIQRLYSEILREGREDLLALLREAWETFGKPLPIKCPVCGFSTIKPDYTCLICGYSVKEEEFRKIIDFNSLFHIFLEIADEKGLRKTLEHQVLVYDPQEGLKSPPPSYGKVQYIIPLKEDELLKIEEKLGLRKSSRRIEKEKVERKERKAKEKPTLDMFLKANTG